MARSRQVLTPGTACRAPTGILFDAVTHHFPEAPMSRGAERSTRQLTDQQLAQQNQLISQSNQQGTQDRSLLLPTIQSLLTSPGFTPAEQSAITQQSMGAANTAFGALRNGPP